MFKSRLCEAPFKGDLTVCPITYQVRKEKCEKITSHLCRRLSVFYVLFLLCIVFGVASYERDHNFLWGQRLLFLKNTIIIKIMIIYNMTYTGDLLSWSPADAMIFGNFLTGADNLDK